MTSAVLSKQVERAAAGGKRGVEAEDIRQPHNALAVRLRQRDPGFSTGALHTGALHICSTHACLAHVLCLTRGCPAHAMHML